MDLIFCAGNNKTYAEIAIETGYLYGAQLPATVHAPVYFADQNYHNPDRDAYMQALSEHRPHIASVIDWEREDQFALVMDWAKQAAQYVDVVMIIPKVHNSIDKIPRCIKGKPIRLGYSVPTSYGGTELFLSEFLGWPVHLLGGSPGKQMELSLYLNVVSVDGNMHMKMACRGLYWLPGKSPYANRWVSIPEAEGEPWTRGNVHHECFRRSCINIRKYWRNLTKHQPDGAPAPQESAGVSDGEGSGQSENSSPTA